MRTSGLLALGLGLALGAFPAASFAEALPPVYFNHVTIFIPAAAYDALRQSSFLRNEFSEFQERTVQRDGGKWSYTGIYIFGQHTYLEFFKAGPDQPHFGTTIAGEVVFNMWIDDRAQLPRFKERLSAEQNATLLIDTTRDARNQPAYDKIVSKSGPAGDFGPGMRVDTLLKGYYPDGITREKRLEDVFLPQRQLHDITGFTLTVGEEERNRLIKQFRAYSYDLRADGAKQVVSGPGITFTLVAVKPHEPRTLTIDFSTSRPTTSQQTYNLDNGGEIRIEGGIGNWAFTFPNE
jgi:Family of unknown function (DUF5829)